MHWLRSKNKGESLKVFQIFMQHIPQVFFCNYQWFSYEHYCLGHSTLCVDFLASEQAIKLPELLWIHIFSVYTPCGIISTCFIDTAYLNLNNIYIRLSQIVAGNKFTRLSMGPTCNIQITSILTSGIMAIPTVGWYQNTRPMAACLLQLTTGTMYFCHFSPKGSYL